MTITCSSSFKRIQQAIVDHLSSPDALRVNVRVLLQQPKFLPYEIEQAIASHGLCVSIFPPLPIRAMQGVPFVFFEACEVRIRIIENPAVNQTGADIYDIAEDVATALHWQPQTAGTPFDGILAHPLQLASRPMEFINQNEPSIRTIDVIFEATLQINPTNE